MWIVHPDYDMHGGIRFQNFNLTSNARIDSAYLSFRGFLGTGTGSVTITCQRDGDPLTFSSYNDFISREKTAISVTWTVPEYGSGDWINTVDVSPLINAVIVLEDYEPRSAIVFFIDEVPDSGYRQLYSYDTDTISGAKLTIVWTKPGLTDDDIIGLLIVFFIIGIAVSAGLVYSKH